MASDDDKSPELLTLSAEERRRMEAEQERRLAELANDISRRYDPSRLGSLAIAGAGRAEKLDDATRREMEQRLGGRFGEVRIVRGPFADRVTKRHRADAVTVGATGIVLLRDTPRTNLGTARGRAVLAHELTHVRQAQQGMHFALEQGASGAAHELEASQVERTLLSDAEQAKAGASGGSDEQRERRREEAIERVLELFEDCMKHQVERLGYEDE